MKGRYTSFYRLPIHVERAVYRLSHIKLANPRRPLYEQVLISNLMFWYLGVINKPAVEAQMPTSTSSQVVKNGFDESESESEGSGESESESEEIEEVEWAEERPGSGSGRRVPGGGGGSGGGGGGGGSGTGMGPVKKKKEAIVSPGSKGKARKTPHRKS